MMEIEYLWLLVCTFRTVMRILRFATVHATRRVYYGVYFTSGNQKVQGPVVFRVDAKVGMKMVMQRSFGYEAGLPQK